MDQTLKTKWVKALRSGKYEQTQDELANEQGYCCLGVLGRVMGVKKERLINHEKSPITFNGYQIINRDSEQFSREGLNLVGITSDTQNKLTTMNDLSNKSFNEIADWIETNL